MKPAICYGNIALDLILRPSASPSSLVFEAFLGGSVSNVSVLLGCLGVRASLVTETGTDFLGDEIFRLAAANKLSTKHIHRSPFAKTAIALARIDKRGNSSYVFYRSRSSGGMKPDTALLKRSGVFHTGSFQTYANRDSHKAALAWLREAAGAGLFVTYDPNWRPKRVYDPKSARAMVVSLLRHVDLLKLSGNDAMGFTGASSPDKAYRVIRGFFKKEVVMTLGDRGSIWRDGKNEHFQPAFKVKVADTIGAGDAFTAGLIYKYLKQDRGAFLASKPANLKFASAVSAAVCTKKGATDGLRNLDQVERFLSPRL